MSIFLQEGDSGQYVVLLQKALGISADGQYGPLTKAAVEAFQSANGLVVDGIVGPLTEAALQGNSVPPVAPVEPPGPIAPIVPVSSVYGCDVYHDDDVQSWSAMLSGGYSFAICKACEGLSADPKFLEYFNGAKQAGLIVGSYAFYSPGTDPVACANYYAGILNNILAKTDFSPCFDFERADGNFSQSDADYCKAFCETIQ
jgi:hypothetical protein